MPWWLILLLSIGGIVIIAGLFLFVVLVMVGACVNAFDDYEWMYCDEV